MLLSSFFIRLPLPSLFDRPPPSLPSNVFFFFRSKSLCFFFFLYISTPLSQPTTILFPHLFFYPVLFTPIYVAFFMLLSSFFILRLPLLFFLYRCSLLFLKITVAIASLFYRCHRFSIPPHLLFLPTVFFFFRSKSLCFFFIKYISTPNS